MTHYIHSDNSKIEVTKTDSSISISIESVRIDTIQEIKLSKEQLSDYIGILLHIQAKLKR